MAKLTLQTVANLRNESTGLEAINDNSDLVEVAIENTLSRDGTSPNEMEANLDMNSFRILNLPTPVVDEEPIRLGDLLDIATEQDIDLLAITNQLILTGTTSGSITVKPKAIAGSWTLTLPDNDGTVGQALVTDGAGITSWGTVAAGVPTEITVANEATDTTCFPLFVTAATGDLGPKTNANMTFNSNTGVITLASAVLTTADINGGTLDAATIGGATPAAGTFTALTANGNTILGDASGDTIVMNAKSITKPNAVIVRAFNSSTDSNVTGNGEVVTIEFDTEDFDRGGDFDTTTDTFTAPITGAYNFSGVLILIGVTAAATIACELVTTGGACTVLSASGALNVSTVVAIAWAMNCVPMTATDTAFVRVTVGNNGATDVDLYGTADGTGNSFAVQLVG